MSRLTLGSLLKYRAMLHRPDRALDAKTEQLLNICLPMDVLRGTSRPSAVDQGGWLQLYKAARRHKPSARTTPDFTVDLVMLKRDGLGGPNSPLSVSSGFLPHSPAQAVLPFDGQHFAPPQSRVTFDANRFRYIDGPSKDIVRDLLDLVNDAEEPNDAAHKPNDPLAEDIGRMMLHKALSKQKVRVQRRQSSLQLMTLFGLLATYLAYELFEGIPSDPADTGEGLSMSFGFLATDTPTITSFMFGEMGNIYGRAAEAGMPELWNDVVYEVMNEGAPVTEQMLAVASDDLTAPDSPVVGVTTELSGQDVFMFGRHEPAVPTEQFTALDFVVNDGMILDLTAGCLEKPHLAVGTTSQDLFIEMPAEFDPSVGAEGFALDLTLTDAF